MSEIEITISLFSITVLHQGVTTIAFATVSSIYCTLQLHLYYSLEPLVEYILSRSVEITLLA